MVDEENRDEKRKSLRIARRTKLKIKFPGFPKFIEKYSKDISEGGMFIYSKHPKPVGTLIQFEIVEKDQERILAGEGIVKWVRNFDPAHPETPTGMGIQFMRLTKESLELIKRIVQSNQEKKGTKTEGFAEGAKETKKEENKKVEEIPKVAPDEIEKMIIEAQYEDKEERDQIKTKGFFTEEVSLKDAKPESVKKKLAPIVGIDLGTTFSCVAYVKNGKPMIIPSKKGYRIIPSIVAFTERNQILTGHDAKPYFLTNPERTVYGSKRMLGRKFRSKIIDEIKSYFKYKIIEGNDGDVAVDVEGRKIQLLVISSLVLKELKSVAEDHFAQRVKSAVITVPAYYSNRQRECVKEAGKLAGFEVKRIVNEPTAAALSYGLNKGLNEKILIYDLGGGTFDVSILEISNNVFEVLASGGDSFLGGLDFDNRIVNYVVEKFKEKTGLDLTGNVQAMQRVMEAAEKAKIDLSLQSQTIVNIPFILGDEKSHHDLVVELTRKKLNELTDDLINKTIRICQEVLRVKGLKREEINEIILVGGQTRMPLVSETLTRIFGRPPKKGVHPDEVVAMGAALLADTFDKIDSVVLLDSLTIPIGVGLPDGRFKPIIPKNTRIPFEKTYSLTTTKDDQTSLEIDIYQGDGDIVQECEYLGTFVFDEIPKAKKGESKIHLQFSLSNECILHLKATESITGKEAEVQMVVKETPDSIKRQFEKEKGK